MSVISQPSTRRRIAAAAIIAAAVLLAVIAKQTRTQISRGGYDPIGFGGMAPDFLFMLGAPLLQLVSPRSIGWNTFATVTGFILVGDIIYEFYQLTLPERVFDYRDIAAACTGSLLSLLLGRILFFRRIDEKARIKDPVD